MKNREELKNNLITFEKGLQDEELINQVINLIKEKSKGETTWPSGRKENN